jgi:hypothetical protein
MKLLLGETRVLWAFAIFLALMVRYLAWSRASTEENYDQFAERVSLLV